MVRSLIYILIFGIGFVAGGSFPGFSLQYKQRVLAQYQQASTDIAPFQAIADRHHGGSMAALIQHHLHSTDPTFYDEGLAIQMMSDGHNSLAAAATALDQPFADQLFYLAQQGNPELAMATWEEFTPVLVTTRQATLFALSIGIICCLLAWLLVNLTSMLVRR
jgi:hypothetical protein